MTLSVQPAVAIFDTARAEACGVAPVGVADPTFFAPITKVQREAGGVRGVTVNDAGQMVDAAGTVGGVPVEAEFDELTGVIKSYAGRELIFSGKFASIIGDGVSDRTAELQAVLDVGGCITIPDGVYVTGPINVRSNTQLNLQPGVVLKAKAGYGTTDCLLNISDVANVTIYAGGARAEMLRDEYVSGEYRHAVKVWQSTDVRIYDMAATGAGGDGFYVGGNGGHPCKNVSIINAHAYNNRRNGASIVNAINASVIGGCFEGQSGIAPQMGIDVESNLADGYYSQGIEIIGVRTENNAGGGILITPQSKYAPVSITVRDHTSYYDGFMGGLRLAAAMAYSTATPAGLIGKIAGRVTVENITIINPQGSGFVSTNWTEYAPETYVRGVYVINPYSNPAVDSTPRNKCGLLLRGEVPAAGEAGTSTGNINIDGLRVIDDRASPIMYSPIYFEPADEDVKLLKNISIKNVEAISGQWTSGSASPLVRAGTLAMTDVSIEYKSDFVVNSGSTSIPAAYMGVVVTNSAGASYTLPVAANHIGTKFTFRVTSNSAALQIAASGSDIIYGLSSEGGGGIIGRYVGMEITVKAIAPYVWKIDRVTPGWAVKTYTPQRYPDSYAAAAPTTGAWQKGDRIYNNNPTSGSYIGWVCTAAGSPGTWVGFGLIA